MRYLLIHKHDRDYNVVTTDSNGAIIASTGTWWDTPTQATSSPITSTSSNWGHIGKFSNSYAIVGNDQDNPELFI